MRSAAPTPFVIGSGLMRGPDNHFDLDTGSSFSVTPRRGAAARTRNRARNEDGRTTPTPRSPRPIPPRDRRDPKAPTGTRRMRGATLAPARRRDAPRDDAPPGRA